MTIKREGIKNRVTLKKEPAASFYETAGYGINNLKQGRFLGLGNQRYFSVILDKLELISKSSSHTNVIAG